MIDHIVDWSRDAPILLLCTARPEFLDTRSDWGGGKLNTTTVLLQPLDPAASADLIANLLGGSGLPAEASARVTEAAGGNPLFVEQMLSMMIDDGQLVRRNGAWLPAGDLGSVAVPPSVAALLAARLERLTDDERRAIECAAVIGKEFYAGAVRDLLPDSLPVDAPDLIRSLIRKELVRTDRSMVPGEDAFRFRHMLIRDAAYQTIPKERRADLHEGFAAWIGRVGGDRAEEQDEIVGYHLEQAFRYRESLGPLDDRARELGRRAATLLAEAGSRALGRFDVVAVANLLGRASGLLEPTDPARIALLHNLAIALWESGSTEESKAVMSDAISRAGDLGDPEIDAHVSLMRWWFEDDLEGSHDRVRSVAEQAAAVFERSGDDSGLARAWHLISSVEWDLGQAGKQLAALDRALEHAQSAGDAFETAEILLSMTAAIVRGPIGVPAGIARAERIIDQHQANRGAEAYACHALAHLRARLGEFDGAREAAERYRGFLQDTGQVIGFWRSAEMVFDIETLAGDTESANAIAQEAYDHLVERDDRWPYLCAFLAQARYAMGRFTDAAEMAEIAASSTNAIEGALGLGVLARVRAREGDVVMAEEQIRKAVEIVERTDFLFDRGTVQLDLGEVMELLGRDEEARAARARALEMFEDKGDLVSAARTRSLLDRDGG